MKSFTQTLKYVLVITLMAGLSFQCEKKEEDDNIELLALGALLSGSGGCTVTAPPRASITTSVTEVTANGTATISKIATVPFAGHQNAALKFTAKNGTDIEFQTGSNAFVIIYKSSACPLGSDNLVNSGFATGMSTSTEFTGSYLLANNQQITFSTAGDYYVFFYAIPSRGQSASITYTMSGL
ncbi:hypothetical protein P3G55_19480 [Leptospira sp. 96542]|nr:hypothetical protein [Leptospira sp. 96542]